MGERSSSKQSKIEIDLTDQNAWDDTLLIKAYDESQLLAPEEVAKQLATETNSLYKPIPTPIRSTTNVKKYKIGDYVRATYTDGIDYEAKIIDILADADTCLLRYVGYNNEEYVKMCDLIPSWGQKACREQRIRSKKNVQSSESEGDGKRPNMRSNRKSKEFEHDIPMNIPPPPPLPPFLDNTEESEHLSAMLMSWYMSGYYTGYYQGIKQAGRNTK